jgi:hypothetical protein
MGFAMNPSGSWQQVALFELSADAAEAVEPVMARLKREIDPAAWLVLRTGSSLPGRAGYEARVDFGIGERRAIYLASHILSGLQRAELPGFRLIAGWEWVELAMAQKQFDTVSEFRRMADGNEAASTHAGDDGAA